MASKNNLTVVLDIGTSKMVTVAGHKTDNGNLEIAGIAKVASKGIKRGIIFNIEEVAASIKQVLSELESGIQEKIELVHVAYAGQHFKTVGFQCSKNTSGEGIVSQNDIDQLFNEAKNAEIGNGYKIIDVIPGAYVIDDETELNPVGITGKNITAKYKLVVLPEEYVIHLQRVFEKVGVMLGEIVLSTLAVSEAVITDDEKEMGVIVLDIGAGTSNLAVFHENMLIHSSVIPFSGDVVTYDIKEGCSILLKWAEQLKVQYGEALGDFADDQKFVTIPNHNGWEPKEISFRSLAFIIQARVEEIIDCVYSQIEKSGISGQLGAGIVVTGGTSSLKNIISLVKYRTGMDARIADPVIHLNEKNDKILERGNFTALGLLKLITKKSDSGATVIKVKPNKKPGRFSPWISKVVQGVLDLVDDENEDIAWK